MRLCLHDISCLRPFARYILLCMGGEKMNISEETMKLAVALSKPIEYLDITKHTYNALRRWGNIETIADLCRICMNGNIQKVRGIGKKSVDECEHLCSEYIKREMSK